MKSNGKIIEKIEKLSYYLVYFLGIIFVLYLAVLSIFGTTIRSIRKISGDAVNEVWEDYTYFMPDSPWKHIIVFCILFAVFLAFYHIYENKLKISFQGRNSFHFLKKFGNEIICILFFVLAACFIFSTRLEPISDQGKILNIARQMAEHDYSQFAFGEYMHRYPDQNGIVFLFYLIHLLAGKWDYLVIQLINAALLACSYYILSKIAGIICKERKKTEILNSILCVIFLPMGIYVTFIYGTIPGLAFSIFAFYAELKYFQKKSIKHIIFACLFINIAIICKTNSLIMFIAMFVFLVYALIIGSNRAKTVWFILAMILSKIICSWAISTAVESQTEIETGRGMPKTAWVAMALQESASAPGIWNGYSVRTFEENGYDYEKTNETAKRKIKDLANVFWHDKSYGLDFFGRKNAAQWNDPSFQSLELLTGRESDVKLPEFFYNLCGGTLSYRYVDFFNTLQSLILIGACLFFFSNRIASRTFREKGNIYVFLPLVAFMGGLLFHMIWEGKPQYILPYYMLLFPYSISGYLWLLEWTYRGITEENKEQRKRNVRKLFVGTGSVCAAIVLISVLSGSRFIAYTVAVRSDAEKQIMYEEAKDKKKNEYIMQYFKE